MRKLFHDLLCFILSFSMVLIGSGCSGGSVDSENENAATATDINESVEDDSPELHFADLSDPNLLRYTEDAILSDFELNAASDDYEVEEVYATYVSKEYLEELEYNSKANIYFGYTLSDLMEQFGEEKYVFDVDENGQTIVHAFEAYDDTFDRVAKNMAIGGGVILICVVVTVATGGAGAPAAVTTVHAVFAASAKTAATFALSSGAISGALSGIVTGYKTGDMNEAMKAAALHGSEAFKWGAITGAITGGAGKALELRKAAGALPSPRQAELDVLAEYGGREQVTFLNGEEVAYGTAGATRPDIVTEIDGMKIAGEVKRYDLENGFGNLKYVLKDQLAKRKTNLPEDYKQAVFLYIRNRGYSDALIDSRVAELTELLAEIDPTIILQVVR